MMNLLLNFLSYENRPQPFLVGAELILQWAFGGRDCVARNSHNFEIQ